MTADDLDLIGRRTWRTLEPVHGAIYFVPEAPEEYAAVGVGDVMAGYFASRSAPMGAVTADVVIATFYNFDHDLVRRCMDGVWDVADPASMLDARLRAADRMIRRLAPEHLGTSDLAEAATLARRAAEVAVEHVEGRPLFAGHARLPWPDEQHLVLWHAQSLLREFRGDGHIAALTTAGLTGCEALVTHAAAGDVPAGVLQATRQRTDDDWSAAIDALRSRGWLDDDGTETAHGRAQRQEIETRTDALAAVPYRALGEDVCSRLRTLARPLSRAMAAALTGLPNRGATAQES